jgi:hypothetical protein
MYGVWRVKRREMHFSCAVILTRLDLDMEGRKEDDDDDDWMMYRSLG